jgi:hypothetical protein
MRSTSNPPFIFACVRAMALPFRRGEAANAATSMVALGEGHSIIRQLEWLVIAAM